MSIENKEIEQLFCKKCSGPREVGRKLCRPCNLERLKESARSKSRYMWTITCSACNKEFQAWRKTSVLCSSCFKISKINKNNNNYLKSGSSTDHRIIAEEVIGRKLHIDEIVHHINDNPKDNRLDNLMIMKRADHTSLHSYLRTQQIIIEQSNELNWNDSIISVADKWIEQQGITATKLSYVKHKHREIAEFVLKRSLRSNEYVHHLDNDRTNNEISNLVVIDKRASKITKVLGFTKSHHREIYE